MFFCYLPCFLTSITSIKQNKKKKDESKKKLVFLQPIFMRMNKCAKKEEKKNYKKNLFQ